MFINYKDIRFLLSIYLILINIVNFILFYIDKRRARKKDWRIPESNFFYIALLGGSLGAILAMKAFRHKNQKVRFKVLLPVCLFINILLLLYLQALIK